MVRVGTPVTYTGSVKVTVTGMTCATRYVPSFTLAVTLVTDGAEPSYKYVVMREQDELLPDASIPFAKIVYVVPEVRLFVVTLFDPDTPGFAAERLVEQVPSANN
jgi:hypothetical protein